MKLNRLAIVLLFLTAAAEAKAQDTKEFILAARRTGVAEIIDPATFETVSRIHFDFHAERLSASPDGSAIYVDGYREDPCCEHYSLDLKTRKLELSASNVASPPSSRLSPDGRWRSELKSFRGPSLKIIHIADGAAHELTPAGLEENLSGNWAADGVWSGDRFNFYIARPDHPGFLWTVAPGAKQLGTAVAVAPFAELSGCRAPLPVMKSLVAADGRLFLFEPFGGKADRTGMCSSPLAGGAWALDAATGRLTGQIGAGFQFNTLIADQAGTVLYGVDPGDSAWSGAVRLVAIDTRTDRVLRLRTFDPGVLQIRIRRLRLDAAAVLNLHPN